jgi:hypothetical protein
LQGLSLCVCVSLYLALSLSLSHSLALSLFHTNLWLCMGLILAQSGAETDPALRKWLAVHVDINLGCTPGHQHGATLEFRSRSLRENNDRHRRHRPF